MNRLKIKDIKKLKNKRPIVCLTSYTAGITKSIDKYVDLILIGDSVGTAEYDMKNTRSVNLNIMKEHGRTVFKSSSHAFTSIDMPYGSYLNKKDALKNAKKLLKYTNCQSIKIETSSKELPIVSHLKKNNITVISHIGVTPQSYKDFTKIKILGRNMYERKKLLKLSMDLEKAGTDLIVLECITSNLAREITKKINIPTIGIGASDNCDGQILVINDLLGLATFIKKPKFVKNYLNLSVLIKESVKKYASDVRNKKFPNKKYYYE